MPYAIALGEMFGALQANPECETGVSIIFVEFEGSDGMAPIRGTGTAELAEDGSLQLEISIRHGGEIQIKAHRRQFFSFLPEPFWCSSKHRKDSKLLVFHAIHGSSDSA